MSRFSVDTVFRGIDRLSSPVTRMSATVGGATKKMERSFRQLDSANAKVHGGITRTARALAGLGVAGGLAAYNIGKTGADYEEAITAVGAVSLKTRDQIAELDARAKQLGATTKFTATQAANAMETMAKAGFSTQDILNGVDGVLSAAAASGLEIAEVADHVSNALKGMGLETSEASRVADVLALASSKTNSTIGSLGESIRNVASTARQFRIPFEEVTAGVALLQDVSLDASVAGSAFNTMLTKMAKPTDTIAAKMEEFGVTFKDAEGNMLPFTQVLQNISKAAKESGGNMDQVAFIADLVGLRGQKAASNLKDLFDTGRVQKLTEELYNAEGAAAKMAAIRMDNLKGDLTLLGSAVDAVKTALFETESGPLRGLVKGMTDWVGKNQELIVSGFADFMADLREALPTIVTWLTRLGKVLVVFYTYAAAVKIAAGAMALFNGVMAASPLTLWIVGITAAIALIWAFWPEISAFFGMLWDRAKVAAAKIGDFFIGAWQTIAEALDKAWQAVKSAASVVFDYLRAAFETAVGIWLILASPMLMLASWLIEKFKPLLPFFSWIWEGIKYAFAAAWEAISALALWYVDKLVAFWTPIIGFFGMVWGGVKTAFGIAWDGIVSAITWYIDTVKSIVMPIVDFFAGIWSGIADAFTSSLGWIFEKLSWALSTARSLGADFLGGGDTPQTVGPAERGAKTLAEANATVGGEITVRAERGTSAAVTGRSGPVGIGVSPS